MAGGSRSVLEATEALSQPGKNSLVMVELSMLATKAYRVSPTRNTSEMPCGSYKIPWSPSETKSGDWSIPWVNSILTMSSKRFSTNPNSPSQSRKMVRSKGKSSTPGSPISWATGFSVRLVPSSTRMILCEALLETNRYQFPFS